MANTFCNPVTYSDGKRHTNPDPFVLSWCGKYYCYSTDEFGVNVSISDDLIQWKYLGYAISEKEYHNYWAPSVFYQNGMFYMYYSNTLAEEDDCHQELLKLAVSRNPEGPFVYQKTFFDQFSIDSHPFFYNGELYMFYSVNDWVGTDNKAAGTCILMDKMKSPWEFGGHPKAVVLPSLPQEIFAENRFGDGRDWYTIEGACTVVRDGKCWILYSANAYVNVDYFVGTAVTKCKKDAVKMKWKKYPDPYTWAPLIRKNEVVEGTGHNTVAKAPNLVDDWMVYHGRSALEELKPDVEQREMRIDPLYYSGDQMICMGPTAKECEAPAQPQFKEEDIQISGNASRMFGEAPEFYTMELWSSGKKFHTGVRYSVYLNYIDEENYTELQVYTGQKKLSVINCSEGIKEVLKEKKLPSEYDYTVPHVLKIQRNSSDYMIQLDEEKAFRFCASGIEKEGKTGIVSYFSDITVQSVTMTCHCELSGEKLKHITAFYKVSNGTITEDGLCNMEKKMELVQKKSSFFAGNYTEEMVLEAIGGRNKFILYNGENEVLNADDMKKSYSVYHIVRGGKHEFLVDGKVVVPVQKQLEEQRISLDGLKLISYRYTQNQ